MSTAASSFEIFFATAVEAQVDPSLDPMHSDLLLKIRARGYVILASRGEQKGEGAGRSGSIAKWS